jgi:hypothetical protein
VIVILVNAAVKRIFYWNNGMSRLIRSQSLKYIFKSRAGDHPDAFTQEFPGRRVAKSA